MQTFQWYKERYKVGSLIELPNSEGREVMWEVAILMITREGIKIHLRREKEQDRELFIPKVAVLDYDQQLSLVGLD